MLTGARVHQGPLPPPGDLAEYDKALPGLASRIVDQWEGETAHRHDTIDYLRQTDRLAMEAYYDGERRGQYLSLVVFVLVAAIAIVAIVLHATLIGIAALVGAAGGVIWSVRRSSRGPTEGSAPVQLDDGDALEKPSQASE